MIKVGLVSQPMNPWTRDGVDMAEKKLSGSGLGRPKPEPDPSRLVAFPT